MTVTPTPIDSAWIAANPLPVHGNGTTKNSRGRVLAIGGSRMVPGALRLTGEAALRVGAGKLQMATVGSAALNLGLIVPEAASIALPEDDDGEIGGAAADALGRALESCDTLVVGPGIGSAASASNVLKLALRNHRQDLSLVIDAMSIGCVPDVRRELAPFGGQVVLTPHHAEMALLTGRTEEEISSDPIPITLKAAQELDAIVVLKGGDTIVAAPDGTLLHYAGGGTGLATGGSGDVLAGAIGGLLSRGSPPLEASGWGVWLHGQSGRRVATTSGPIGFLARELPVEFPRLLPQ